MPMPAPCCWEAPRDQGTPGAPGLDLLREVRADSAVHAVLLRVRAFAEPGGAGARGADHRDRRTGGAAVQFADRGPAGTAATDFARAARHGLLGLPAGRAGIGRADRRGGSADRSAPRNT